MKRIISILLISAILLSFSGCKSKQQAEDAKNTLAANKSSKIEGATKEDFPWGEDDGILFTDYVIPPINTVEDLVKGYSALDVFVGKVVDVEVIQPKAPAYQLHRHAEGEEDEICGQYYRLDRRYDEYFLLDSDLYLYTVEIEKSINSVFTTENTTIQIIVDIPYVDTKLGISTTPWKVGERYILSGRLWQYGEKTMLRASDAFTSKVDENGNIEGLEMDAKIMNEFGTVENFIASKDIAKIFNENGYYIGDGFKRDYNLSSIEIDPNSKDENVQKLISDGKKALPIDSKFKMPVKTDIIGDLSDDNNRIPTNAELKIQQGVAESE